LLNKTKIKICNKNKSNSNNQLATGGCVAVLSQISYSLSPLGPHAKP